MSLTINIRPPFQTPTLDNVSRNAGGGSWPAGTYDFALFSVRNKMDTAPFWRSALSNIETLAISANDSVTFNYTIPVEASIQPQYIIILFRVTGSGNPWKQTEGAVANWYGIPLATYPATYTCSDKSSSSEETFHTILENFTINGEDWFGLDTDCGSGLIDISGSSGTIDLGDVITAVKASSMVSGSDYNAYNDFALFTNYGISLKDATGGTFALQSAMIHVLGGFSNSGSGIDLACDLNSNMMTSINCPLLGAYGATIVLENCDLDGIVLSKGVGLPLTTGYPLFNVKSGIVKNSTYIGNNDIILADIFSDTMLYLPGGARLWDNGIYDKLTILAAYIYVQSTYGATINNCLLKTSLSYYQIFWLPNHATNYTIFRDSEFRNQSDESVIGYDDLDFYDLNAYGINSKIDFEVTFTLSLNDTVENGGAAISGKTVRLKDKNGSTVFETTTDESGDVSEYVTAFRHENITTESSGSSRGTNTNFNPFTLEIDGDDDYQDYSDSFDLTEKTHLEIALQDKSGGGGIINASFIKGF